MMKYDGPDVNRLISNGLMSAGALLDRNKPAEAPVASPAHRVVINPVQEPAVKIVSPRSEKAPSVISHCVKLTGSIETPEELHIYGTINGNVRASALVIFEGGVVKGEVFADIVTVHGVVEGSIQGKKVQLVSTAIVRGDIFHDTIGIDPGALFEGASKRIAVAVANDDVSEAA